MKRWLVALLVLLAVTVLVSPGIIGRLAQDNLEHALPGVTTHGEDDYIVTRQSFERGWFTAEGRHRIDIRRGGVHDVLLALAGIERENVVPALIVDTRIDHGLVPVTSLSRESGTLRPGLASTVSTVVLDLGDGEPVAVPGKLYSNIGLTGDTASRYLLEAGSFRNKELAASWEGADISFTVDAAGRSAEYAGRMQPFVVRSEADAIRVDGLRFEGDVDRTGIGLHVGSLALESGTASVGTGSFGTAAVEALSLRLNSSLDDDERLRGAASMSVTGLDLPEDEAPVDLQLELAIDRIDARALAAVTAELRQARARASGGHAGAIEHDALVYGLRRLLSAGGELRLDSLDVALPQGKVTSRLRFELPETDAAEPYSWPSLLLALSASADVELSVAVVEALLETRPDMQGLVAAGILKREGDVYSVKAEYAQGILTVNGAPLPVPLPGREAPSLR